MDARDRGSCETIAASATVVIVAPLACSALTAHPPSMRQALRSSLLGALALTPAVAWGGPPNGAPLLRMLGPRAQSTLEPHAHSIGAVVRVPSSLTDASMTAIGLRPFAPGFARLRGTSDQLIAFADAHPDLPLEVATPPHLLLDKVGVWTNAIAARQEYGVDGTGVLIGVVDTGIDWTLQDFNDPTTGKTRVAWLLDLSADPAGIYPDLEAQFGGAVYAGSDLDTLLGKGQLGPDTFLTDTVGHGTHVASIAAGNGGLAKRYVGIAPGAQLIIARITGGMTADIATDDLLSGVQFAFDRADTMKKPIAVNLSIGSDFGSHDGTMAWEEALAGYVGPTFPGHALVAAAGNSGDITAAAVHQTVFVPPGESRTIPITTLYAGTTIGTGQVQVWITMRGGAQLSVGIDSPTGTWVSPVGAVATGAFNSTEISAGVYNGSSVSLGMIQSGSNSALAVWGTNTNNTQAKWEPGIYSITLGGGANGGTADLYVEGTGDAIDDNGNGVGFTNPVREGTINIPATHPGIIGVGCTVSRGKWTSIAGGPVSVAISPLDPRGGYAVPDASYYSEPVTGDVCWFSSAGPTVTGVQKPEISAPGGIVIGAMSGWAAPTAPYSIFTNPDCPPVTDGGVVDDRCMQVDATHAVAAGTSMSAPQAAATAALLFQRDPTLTQDKIVGLLQAGAHHFRGLDPFEDQGGPGEIDVRGSLDALDQLQDPLLALPSKATSWITLSADELAADGSTPLTAIVELRTGDGAHRADYFDGTRLQAAVDLDGAKLTQQPPIQRRAPGVWFFTVTPPPGLGGHSVTLGATFDGVAIVTPKTVPIATETWTANYGASAAGSGGCDVHGRGGTGEGWAVGLLLAAANLRRRRRSRS